MKRIFCLSLMLFILLLSGCQSEETEEIDGKLVFWYDSARIDVPEIQADMENGITRLSSYSSCQEAFPTFSSSFLTPAFFEEYDLFFISFMTTKSEGAYVLLSEVYGENRTLYFQFTVSYIQEAWNDSAAVYCRYGVQIKKNKVRKYDSAAMKVSTVSDVPVYLDGEPLDLHSSRFYKCHEGKAYGYNTTTDAYDIPMEISLS